MTIAAAISDAAAAIFPKKSKVIYSKPLSGPLLPSLGFDGVSFTRGLLGKLALEKRSAIEHVENGRSEASRDFVEAGIDKHLEFLRGKRGAGDGQ